MPRILFVCLHRPDRSPSQRFRFEQYLGYLKENNFDYTFSFLLNEKDDKAFYAKGKYLAKGRILLKSILRRWKEIQKAKSYDIVFVQRECFMLGTAFFEKGFAKKTKLVFDFDDSIWLQNVSEGNKTLAFLKNADKTKEIIKSAHLVVAGNKYLADYALQFNSNTVIVPTTIDTDIYRPVEKKSSYPVCIGWSGSFTTIQHFKFREDALKKIKEKYKDRVVFKVIGDGSYYNKDLDVKGQPWKKATEVSDLEEIDIGIMPLPDDEWANGKCGLKGLQYMAFAIPTIMSPVGVNTEIIQDGVNGFLADSEDEWFEKLSLLIESFELRKKIGEEGRKTVVEKYSVEANQHLYLKYFSGLIKQNHP
jgi:glycosyltransferase involved in cell wall biosynthesis